MQWSVVKVYHRPCGGALGAYQVDGGWVRPTRDRITRNGVTIVSSLSAARVLSGQAVKVRGMWTGTGLHIEGRDVRLVCSRCGTDEDLEQPLALEYRDGVAYI